MTLGNNVIADALEEYAASYQAELEHIELICYQSTGLTRALLKDRVEELMNKARELRNDTE